MKKKITTLFALGGLFASSFAQITITQNDLVKEGMVIFQATDTNAYNLLSGGANQTWNLSTLKSIEKDTIVVGANSWYMGYQNFPDANLGSPDGDSSTTFIKLTPTEFSVVGSYSVYNGEVMIDKSSFMLLKLPASFNGSYTGNSSDKSDPIELGIDPDGIGPLPKIDSFYTVSNSNTSTKMDAWGKLTLPSGTYDVLRSREESISSTDYWIKYSGSWSKAPKAVVDFVFGENAIDTSYTEQYWSNNANTGFPVLSIFYDKGDTKFRDASWMNVKTKISNVQEASSSDIVLFPNPVTSVLNIQLQSTAAKVVLMDANGRELKATSASELVQFDLTDFSSGIYHLVIYQENGVVLHRNVIKN